MNGLEEAAEDGKTLAEFSYGIKLIEGVAAGPGDPEFKISRGRLMPSHHVLGTDAVSVETNEKLQQSSYWFTAGWHKT